MPISCVLSGNEAIERVDTQEDIEPIGAMDTFPIDPNLTLNVKKLRAVSFISGDEEIERLIRYFEAVKGMIHGSLYGITSRDIALAMPTLEPDLGKKEYDTLHALGVVGKMESTFYLSMMTVYIDTDSALLKKD